jgi:hypothetical protein
MVIAMDGRCLVHELEERTLEELQDLLDGGPRARRS